jgi:hypothetical protein
LLLAVVRILLLSGTVVPLVLCGTSVPLVKTQGAGYAR